MFPVCLLWPPWQLGHQEALELQEALVVLLLQALQLWQEALPHRRQTQKLVIISMIDLGLTSGFSINNHYN